MIREKHIISGKMFEAEFYPIFSDGRKIPERRPKEKLSPKAQQNLNDKNSRKKLTRLINTNFGQNDIVIHGTYRDNEMPSTEEEVRKDVVNYNRRIKAYRKKHGLPEMKYIYVIEAKVSKKTGVLRWHFHMLMSEMDRNVAEEMWPHGDWTNADRLQPNEKGCEALAKYLVKDPQGSKRWAQSRNLKKPHIPKPKDGKITKQGVKKLATQKVDDREYWEKRYKGYRFVEAQPEYNEFNGHWYLSIVMYKTNEILEKRRL